MRRVKVEDEKKGKEKTRRLGSWVKRRGSRMEGKGRRKQKRRWKISF